MEEKPLVRTPNCLVSNKCPIRNMFVYIKLSNVASSCFQPSRLKMDRMAYSALSALLTDKCNPASRPKKSIMNNN